MYFATFWKFVQFAVVGATLSVFGVDAQKISSFSCDGRTSGYYADVSTGCQVYHMCDGLGRQFTYRCPSKTLFQQRMLICDHWYMVNCSKAEEDYSANLLIGQPGKAFVEELQFHRTPRPDLVDPVNSDYSIYQTGQEEIKSIKNVVARSTTPAPTKREESGTAVAGFVKQVYYKTTYNGKNKLSNDGGQAQEKGLDLNSVRRFDNSVNADTKTKASNNEGTVLQNGVNFPSRFKATTPVYPEHLNIDLSKFTDFGNPLDENLDKQASVNFPSKFRATTPVYPKHVQTDSSKLSEFDIPVEENRNDVKTDFVNFASNFKATTPVYPLHVNLDPSKLSEFDLPVENEENEDVVSVNFASKFKATTPVYPKHVDVDLSKFSGSEEEPPKQEDEASVNFPSKFKATTPVYPQHVDVDLSKFLEPVELPEKQSVLNNTVNFGSNFKATTPVYPQSVEATSPIPEEFGLLPPVVPGSEANNNQASDNSEHVNFASNFQATTPVYPISVEPTSPDPNNVGLSAPQPTGKDTSASELIQEPSIDIQPPSFDSTFKRRLDEEDPSVIGNTFSSRQLTEFMLTIKPEQLRDLKQMWHIPDYDFPLETASRPSYESDFSSFQAIPKAVKSR